MADIQIQFLAFQGCPHAGAARLALRQALAECEIGDYEEIDILDPSVSAGLRNWGSPTILVNGDDLSGRLKGDGVGCRIYPGADGVPNPGSIVACIEEARARGALRR